jgi:hypothetical protein
MWHMEILMQGALLSVILVVCTTVKVDYIYRFTQHTKLGVH